MWSIPSVTAGGFALGDATRLMRRPNPFHLIAALLAFPGLIGMDARSAELEDALQHPSLSVGEDAQPPPPARMVPSRVSPLHMELDARRRNMPPSTERLFIPSPIRFDQSG